MWTLTNDKQWSALTRRFPEVRDMAGVVQDPYHHAEGDVAIHTQLVLDSLVADPDYQSLQASDQELLWTAALLHDVEKRSTTVIESDGRITSRGHARKGERTAREMLYTGYSPHSSSGSRFASWCGTMASPSGFSTNPIPKKRFCRSVWR